MVSQKCIGVLFVICLCLLPVQCHPEIDVSGNISEHSEPVIEIRTLDGENVSQVDPGHFWIPWRNIQYSVSENGRNLTAECPKEDSLDDLPTDLFTRNYLRPIT